MRRSTRVTDLEEFSLSHVWRPYQNLFDESWKEALPSPPFDLDETARLLSEDTEWSRLVLDRIGRIGFHFPSYIVHPLVDVVRNIPRQPDHRQ